MIMPIKVKKLKKLLLLLWCIVLLTACTQTFTAREVEQTNTEWLIAKPSEVGLDPFQLNKIAQSVQNGTYRHIHSILIIKDGFLVFEEYFPGYQWDYNADQFQGEWTDYSPDTLHNLASVTKSFTSVLVGIAIDQGFISSVDEKVFSFFPEYNHLNDDQKDEITIEDLLTMTSGLSWNGMEVFVGTRNPRNDLIQLFQAEDPVDYILAKPLVSEPGTRWYYHGGGTNLLGVIIHRATGMRMDQFAEQYLFAPLGIEKHEWDYINADIVHASGNLALRPRDMAKLGYLFLNNGQWGDKQIISEEWVLQSTRDLVSTSSGEGYGYQWWVKTYRSDNRDYDVYYAAGWGGQRIIVFPDHNMVVLFTGGNYVTPEPIDQIIEDFLLPAVR